MRISSLIKARLDQADLRGVDFSGAKLREAVFCGSNLQGAKFGGADLTGTDFHRGHLRGRGLFRRRDRQRAGPYRPRCIERLARRASDGGETINAFVGASRSIGTIVLLRTLSTRPGSSRDAAKNAVFGKIVVFGNRRE